MIRAGGLAYYWVSMTERVLVSVVCVDHRDGTALIAHPSIRKGSRVVTLEALGAP